MAVARTTLGVVADRLGGAYVWWLEDRALYLTRLDPNGAIATGWPARGRLLGTTASTRHISVIGDGGDGIYAAWVVEQPFSLDGFSILAMHLGPSNVGAGGWPNTTRSMAPGTDVTTLELWPKLALAPDGGIFVGWASGSNDTLVEPNGWRLTRRTSAGLSASGWPVGGIDLGSFDYFGFAIAAGANWHRAPLLDVAPDGRGGVFFLLSNFVDEQGGWLNMQPKLLRLAGDGSTAPDWPAEGRWHTPYPQHWSAGPPDAGYRVVGDAHDGALVGEPFFYDHATALQFHRIGPGGGVSYATEGDLPGVEFTGRDDGGLYLASFHPTGPAGAFTPPAFLLVRESGTPPGETLFQEVHDEPLSTWYGDIGIASTGDGGAVFFWSQSRDRIGLFALRFGPNGQTVAVPAPMGRLALHSVRFVPGRGFVAALDLPGNFAGRLELFDVLGRRVGDVRLSPSEGGTREVELRTHPVHGLYLARLSAAGQAVSRKVLRLDR